MAQLLLLKLLEPNTSKRYTADNVLKHPWITRNSIDEIPKTYLETMRIRTLKNKIINV
jgi:serine/threonine protein kinase